MNLRQRIRQKMERQGRSDEEIEEVLDRMADDERHDYPEREEDNLDRSRELT